MIKIRNFNSTILFTILILTCSYSTLYAKTKTGQNHILGDFQEQHNGSCYLSTPKEFSAQLRKSVSSFQTYLADNSITSVDASNLINFAENLAKLEVKKNNGDLAITDLVELTNNSQDLLTKFEELSVVTSIKDHLNDEPEAFKSWIYSVRNHFPSVAQKISFEENRPYFFSETLSDVANYVTKATEWESLKDQETCLNRKSIERFDEIYQDLNTETVKFNKLNADTFTLNKESLDNGAIRYGFWLNLSLSTVLNGNKTVFSYINKTKTLSLELAVGQDGASIDQIFKVGDKSYVINNSSPCVDLEFITINLIKQFNNYLIRFVVKSTYLNNRKAIEIPVPAEYIEFGTFTFPNHLLVRACDIYELTLVRPGYCKEEKDVITLQEIELITQIPEQSIIDSQDLIVDICNSKPEECAYYKLNECLVCKEGFHLLDTVCVKKCPDGSFENTAEKKCNTCNENCKACNSNDSCTACKEGEYLWKGKCDSVCPSYTFPVNQECKPCGDDCEVCNGPDTCAKCKTQYLYKEHCTPECPEGTFTSTNPNACNDCGADCKKCTNSQTCNRCDAGHYLLNGQCVEVCPKGKFPCDKSGKCQICPSECLECENKLKCTVCANEYELHNDKCVSDCPKGYVPKNNVCIPCAETCDKCNPDDTTQCHECSESFYLKGTKCVPECGDGFFADHNRVCQKCLDNCVDCNRSDSCNECKVNFFNFKGQQCLPACPDGWVGKDKECVACDEASNCKTCYQKNLSNCKTCFEQHFLNKDKCVEECPKGTYTEGRICKNCDETCETCDNGLNCNTCKPGYLLKNGKCVKDCGDGYSSNSVACHPCSVSDCIDCSSSEDQCKKCETGLFLFGTFCIKNCVEGYFPTEDFTCEPCFDNCKLCSNGSTCDECITGLTLSVNKDKCLEQCPDKTVPIAHECKNCENLNCKKCAGDKITCVECQEGEYLYNRDCVRTCPTGTIPNESTKTCDACKSPCFTCKGSVDHCTSCVENYVLLPDNTCSDDCPDFQVNVNKVCKSCDNVHCKICSHDLKECSSCDDKSFLHKGDCIENCPVGFYGDNKTRTCLPCSTGCDHCKCDKKCLVCEKGKVLFEKVCIDLCPYFFVAVSNSNGGSECHPCANSSCLECSAENTNNCNRCDSTTFLFEGQCINNCPNGYRQNVEERTCEKCKVNSCGKCVDTVETCTKCTEGLVLLNNECIPNCPAGYREEAEKCYPCTVNQCDVCTTSADTCEKCKEKYFKLSDTQCSETCPEKQYPIPGTQSCHNCNVLCESCIDSNRCTVCVNGYFLRDDGVCVLVCKDGYVGNPSTGTCEPCAKGCEKCLPGDQDKCSVCETGYFLFVADSSCRLECPEGFFKCEKSRKCQTCDVTCKTCSKRTSCDTCKENLIKHDDKCIDQCPNFYANVDNKCTECKTSELCLKCNPADLEECINCGEFILFEKRCHKTCPEGFYKLSNNTCEKCTENCQICDNSDSCRVCSGNFKLLPNGKCSEECEDGYVDVNKICEKCDDKNCKTCSLDKTCEKCAENSYLKVVDGLTKCVHDCGEGFFLEGDKCKKCTDENCVECSSTTDCRKCKEGLSLLNETQCIKECPVGLVSINGVCEHCEKDCNKCCHLDKSKCLQCKLPKVLLDGDCKDNCPETFVELVSEPGKCTKCSDDKCLVCCSKDKDICKTCKPGLVVDQNGKCVEKCDSGYAANNHKCAPCQVKDCVECDGSLLECNNCKAPKVNFLGFCLEFCPEGLYSLNSECKECNNCPTCENETGKCTDCHEGYFLTAEGTCKNDCTDGTIRVNDSCVPCGVADCKSCPANDLTKCNECKGLQRLYKNECVDKCPVGTFESDNKTCTDCGANCLVCTDASACNTCNPGFVLQGKVCKNVCDEGFVDVEGVCKECTNSNNCSKCSVNNLEKCENCKEGFFLKGDKCVTDCGEGYLVVNGICKPCEANCLKCASEDSCSKCHEDYVLFNHHCIPTCPQNYVEVNNECKKCTNSLCLVCSIDNQDICSKCDETRYLKDNQCVTTCGLGFYPNEERKCVPCEDDNCNTCCPKSKKCKDCKEGFFLFNGVCKTACPTGYIADSSDVCVKCEDNNCSTCKLTDLAKCSECLVGVLQGDKCKDVCDLKFFEKEKVCVPCGENCLECENSSTCNRCEAPYVLSDHKCKSECPDGFIEVDGKCLECHGKDDGCLQCDNSQTLCKKCKTPKVLYDNECVDECTVAQYSNGSTCKPCEANCDSCVDDTECKNCKEGFFLYLKDCFNPCPKYTFANNETKTCDFCTDHVKCVSCDAEKPDNCTECSSGILFEGKCIDQCPPETYFCEKEKTCKKCEENCELCASKETCNKCKSGFFLFNDNCIDKCPVSYVDVGAVCKPCNENCATCFSNNLNVCKTCVGELVLFQGECIPKCPVGTFIAENEQGVRVCLVCNEKCTSCNSADSCQGCTAQYVLDGDKCVDNCPEKTANVHGVCKPCADGENCLKCCAKNLDKCLDCKDGLFILDGKCLPVCPEGFYADSVDEKCKKCNSTCSKCTNSLECTECASGFHFKEQTFECIRCPVDTHLVINGECRSCKAAHCDKCVTDDQTCQVCSGSFVLIDGVCREKCPQGSYQEGQNCHTCSDGCVECTNGDSCTKCSEYFYLYEKQCVETCPPGYGYDSNNNCRKCTVENCQVCDGNTPDICKKCNDDVYLHDNKCANGCPEGHYPDEKLDKCFDCPENCKHCSENGTKCNECDEGFYLKNGVCINTCGDGYFKVEVSKTCNVCSTDGCKECEKNTCTKCAEGLILFKKDGVITCVPRCDSGYYKASENGSDVCRPCGTACSQCTDDQTCLVCLDEGLVLFKGKCINICPIQYTRVGNECQSCSDSACELCESNLPNICDKCLNGYLLEDHCVEVCPIGYYHCEHTKKCKKCDEKCVTCDEKDKCTECKTEYVLVEGVCTNECPNGTFNHNGQCKPCNIEGCSACVLKGTETKCTECDKKTFLLNGVCVAECPAKFFSDENRRCNPCKLGCKSCTSEDKCVECHDNYYSFNSQCLVFCPENTFHECETKKCVKCAAECLSCYSNKADSCYRCAGGLIKHEGKCVGVETCGEGYFSDITQHTCTKCNLANCVECDSLSKCRRCERGTELVEGECRVVDKSVVQLINEAVLQTPLSFNYEQKTFFKLSELSQITFNKTLYVTFNVRDLKVRENLSNKDESVLLSIHLADFDAQFVLKKEDEHCYLRVFVQDKVYEVKAGECSSRTLFNWHLLAFGFNLEKSKLNVEVKTQEEEIVTQQIDLIYAVNTIVNEESYIQVLDEKTAQTLGSQIAKLKVLNFHIDGQAYHNSIEDVPSKYNWSCEVNNTQCESGFVPLGEFLPSNSDVVLSNKGLKNKYQAAFCNYGYAGYHFIDRLPEDDSNVLSILYPYNESPLGEVRALAINLTSGKTEASNGLFKIDTNALKAKNWYYIRATIENTHEGAKYNLVVLDGELNTVVESSNIVEEEANFVTRLYADATVHFTPASTGNVYSPIILTNSLGPSPQKISELASNDLCLAFGENLKCVQCQEFYAISADGLCVDDAVNHGKTLFDFIQSYNNNDTKVNIPEAFVNKSFTVYFALRKLAHSLSKTNNVHSLLSVSSADKTVSLIKEEILADYHSNITLGENEAETLNYGDVNYNFTNVVVVYNAAKKTVSVFYFGAEKVLRSDGTLSSAPVSFNFFDKLGSEIHFEALNGNIYPSALKEETVNALGNRSLQANDPLCKTPNWETGICRECNNNDTKIANNVSKCPTGVFGLNFLQLLKENSPSSDKSVYALNTKINNSVNSELYAVTTRFNIYRLPEFSTHADGEYDILNLRNNVHLDETPVDPSNRLISLKVEVNAGVPRVAIVLNNSVELVRIYPEEFKFTVGSWNFFSGTINVREKTFSYVLINQFNANDTAAKVVTLNNYSEKLQNAAELEILGGIKNENHIIGEAINSFLIPNPPSDLSKLNGLFNSAKYTPQIPAKLDNCLYSTVNLETNASVCVICTEGSDLVDDKCVEQQGKETGFHVLDTSSFIERNLSGKVFRVTQPFSNKKLIFSVALRTNHFESGHKDQIVKAGDFTASLGFKDNSGVIYLAEGQTLGPFKSDLFRNWNNLYVVITPDTVKVCLVACGEVASKDKCLKYNATNNVATLDKIELGVSNDHETNGIQLAGLHTIQHNYGIVPYSICDQFSCNIECDVCHQGECLSSNALKNDSDVEVARFIELTSDHRSQTFFRENVAENYKTPLRTDSYSIKFVYKRNTALQQNELLRLDLSQKSNIKIVRNNDRSFSLVYTSPNGEPTSVEANLEQENFNNSIGFILSVKQSNLSLLVYDSEFNYKIATADLPESVNYLTNNAVLALTDNVFEKNVCSTSISKVSVSLNKELSASDLKQTAATLVEKLQDACLYNSDARQNCTECKDGYRIITNKDGKNVCAVKSGAAFSDTTDLFEIGNNAQYTANFEVTDIHADKLAYITTIQLNNVGNDNAELYRIVNDEKTLLTLTINNKEIEVKNLLTKKSISYDLSPDQVPYANTRYTIFTEITKAGKLSLTVVNLESDFVVSREIAGTAHTSLLTSKDVKVVYNNNRNLSFSFIVKGTVLYLNSKVVLQNVLALAFKPTAPCNFSSTIDLLSKTTNSLFAKLSQTVQIASIKDFENYKCTVAGKINELKDQKALLVSNSLVESDFLSSFSDLISEYNYVNSSLGLLFENNKLIFKVRESYEESPTIVDLTPAGHSVDEFSYVKVQIYANSKDNLVIVYSQFDNVSTRRIIKLDVQTINARTGVSAKFADLVALDLTKSNELINNNYLEVESNNNVCGNGCNACTEEDGEFRCTRCSENKVLSSDLKCVSGFLFIEKDGSSRTQ